MLDVLVNVDILYHAIPSLKLTAKAPENEWLEYSFPFGARPIFSGEHVSFREGNIFYCL